MYYILYVLYCIPYIMYSMIYSEYIISCIVNILYCILYSDYTIFYTIYGVQGVYCTIYQKYSKECPTLFALKL